MDELEALVAATERARPIPDAMRERLLAAIVSEPALDLEGIDEPRALPTGTRERLADAVAVTLRRTRRQRRAFLLSGLSTAAAVVFAVVVIAVRHPAPITSARVQAEVAATPETSGATPGPEAAAQAATSTSASSAAAGTTSGSAGGGAAGFAQTVRRASGTSVPYRECFPTEPCPQPTPEPVTSTDMAAESAYGGGSSTPAPPPPTPTPSPPPRAPSAPRNLTAQRGPGLGEITLTWQAPSDTGSTPIVKYGVYRRTENGDESFLAVVDGTSLTFTDTKLATANYTYRVRARNDRRLSPYSHEATAFSIGTG